MAKTSKINAGRLAGGAKKRPGPSGGKHEVVTSASLDRRAAAHLGLSQAHTERARGMAVSDPGRVVAEACAKVHEETAAVLKTEAVEIRKHHGAKG